MLIQGQSICLNARTALLVPILVALPLHFSLAAEQQPKRKGAAAVLHGRVRNEGGEPLAGVRNKKGDAARIGEMSCVPFYSSVPRPQTAIARAIALTSDLRPCAA